MFVFCCTWHQDVFLALETSTHEWECFASKGSSCTLFRFGTQPALLFDAWFGTQRTWYYNNNKSSLGVGHLFANRDYSLEQQVLIGFVWRVLHEIRLAKCQCISRSARYCNKNQSPSMLFEPHNLWCDFIRRVPWVSWKHMVCKPLFPEWDAYIRIC